MFFTVHSAKSHKALSAPLATYRDALRWIKEFQPGTPGETSKPIPVRIVCHKGLPPQAFYQYNE